MERLIARITDERLNNGLPPFLHRGPAGLNSGLMGAQVTATALLAEMRAGAAPASVQSLSTNGANQDVVSMGTIAARRARDQIGHLSHILATGALSLAQAVDITGVDGYGSGTRAIHALIRSRSDRIDCDRPLAQDIEDLAAMLLANDPPGMIEPSELGTKIPTTPRASTRMARSA